MDTGTNKQQQNDKKLEFMKEQTLLEMYLTS